MAEEEDVEREDFEQEAYDEWIERGFDPEDFELAAMAKIWEDEENLDKAQEVVWSSFSLKIS